MKKIKNISKSKIAALLAASLIFGFTVTGCGMDASVEAEDSNTSSNSNDSSKNDNGTGTTDTGSNKPSNSGPTNGNTSNGNDEANTTKPTGNPDFVMDANKTGYTLVWSDEFTTCDPDGTPDSSKWGYDVGRGQSKNTDGTNPDNWAWGNGELQWYSDNDSDNTYVSNGTLKIVAKKEQSNGADYTSGRIVTRNIPGGQFKYGYIEMSAKIPNDKGVWPAFWMLDNDIYNGEGWPGSGEIDIMESSVNLWGSDNVYGTLHCDAGSGGSPVFTRSSKVSFSDGKFHKYAVDWDDNYIAWYYDDVKVFTYTPASFENSPWPFCDDFYIILNLAVGGNLGGEVPENFTTSTMEVDYVRVYQKDSGYVDANGYIPVAAGAPKSVSSKAIPANSKVIFDALGGNSINKINYWWGQFAINDYKLADNNTVKQICFNENKACGGWYLNDCNFTDNAKLHLTVSASDTFKVQTVVGGKGTPYEFTVSESEKGNWKDIEINLGSANTLSELGFISETVQKIYVDHVYITSSNASQENPPADNNPPDSGDSINWDSYDYAGDGAGGGAYSNKYKFYSNGEKVSLVNIQTPGFASEAGLYVTFPAGISSCSLNNNSYVVQGAGICLYLSAFTKKETEFTVTDANGTYKCVVYYADGTN